MKSGRLEPVGFRIDHAASQACFNHTSTSALISFASATRTRCVTIAFQDPASSSCSVAAIPLSFMPMSIRSMLEICTMPNYFVPRYKLMYVRFGAIYTSNPNLRNFASSASYALRQPDLLPVKCPANLSSELALKVSA